MLNASSGGSAGVSGEPRWPRNPFLASIAATFLLLGPWAAGCASVRAGAGEFDASAAIHTDRRVYRLRPALPPDPEGVQVAIIATYHNRAGHTIRLAPCEHAPPRWRLEKRVGAEWVRAYEPFCYLIGHLRLPALEPGEARTDTLLVRHYHTVAPRFRVNPIPGTYRLVYEVYTPQDLAPPDGEGHQRPLRESTAVSNEFRIEH